MIPPLPLCFDHLSVGPTSLLKNTYAPDESMNDSSTPRNSVIDGGAGTYIESLFTNGRGIGMHVITPQLPALLFPDFHVTTWGGGGGDLRKWGPRQWKDLTDTSHVFRTYNKHRNRLLR